MRAVLAVLDRYASSGAAYVTEQATSTFVYLQKKYANVRGSEFESDPVRRGRLTAHLHKLGGSGSVEYQDVTALTFVDSQFDTVVSLDVLEHVPDYRAALAEFGRALKPNGKLIATFPFNDRPETVVRAEVGPDGKVVHLLEPEFHGDPISGGVLCFYRFGWDVLTQAREVGFSEARMLLVWAPEEAIHFGHWVLLATK